MFTKLLNLFGIKTKEQILKNEFDRACLKAINQQKKYDKKHQHLKKRLGI